MGFGSYDESEQQNQNIETKDEDSEGVDVHENAHDGSVTFENNAETDELIDRLAEMKTDADAE